MDRVEGGDAVAGTFKGSYGHMPLGAWVANTRGCPAMLLRPGNAPPNDVADHKTVLAAALRGLPLPLWSKVPIRIDGAACTWTDPGPGQRRSPPPGDAPSIFRLSPEDRSPL